MKQIDLSKEFKDLQRILHRGGENFNIALFSGEKRHNQWFSVGEVPDVVTYPYPNGTQPNVYFPINAVSRANATSYQSARKEDIKAVNAFFVDLDVQSEAHKSGQFKDKDEALNKLDDLILQPSIIIDSGGGLYALFLLTEPVYVGKDKSAKEIEALIEDIIEYAGGDPNAKGLQRLMRVPGTINPKYADNPTVRVLKAEYGLTYTFDQIREIVPQRESKRPKGMFGKGAAPRVGTDWVHSGRKLDVNDFSRALETLSAEYYTNYNDWLVVVFAAIEFRGTDLEDAALEVLHKFSQQWEHYKPADVMKKFYSSANEHKKQSEGGFDLESLYNLAAQFGFRIEGLSHKPTFILDKNAPQAKKLIKLIASINDPVEIMVNGRTLVLVKMQKQQQNDGSTVKVPHIHKLTVYALREWLLERISFLTVNSKGEYVPARPQIDLCTALLDYGEWPGIPVVNGVVSSPFYTHDAQLVVSAGYNPQAAVYHVPGLGGVNVPSNPTAQQLKDAKGTIEELIQDFPFKDDASKVNFIAEMLQPFVRRMFDLAPIYSHNAPTQGTGKTLLAEIGSIPFLGNPASMTNYSERPGENEKYLVTRMLGGNSHIVLDNVPDHVQINDPSLAAIVTSTSYSSRLLGGNTEAIFQTGGLTIIITGNYLQPSQDINRRLVKIDLVADTPNPEQRKGFAIQDLRRYTRANRKRIVEALLTLVENWKAKGKPQDKSTALGGFESYTRIMGGILRANGYHAFLGNHTTSMVKSVQHTQWQDFFTQWVKDYGRDWVTTSDLYDIAFTFEKVGGEIVGHGILEGEISNATERGNKIALGKELQKRAETAVLPHTFLRVKRGEYTQYRLETAQPAPQKNAEQPDPNADAWDENTQDFKWDNLD